MKYGFVYPGGEPKKAVEAARQAEASGWDGFFMWDPVWGVDAWSTLGAIAVVTERIRLGTMITPLSRRRPWTVASQTVTVDRLSSGRLILSVGLGAVDTGFIPFGEQTDRKIRAELLDEGLDILTGLWKGQPFRYDGKHYHLAETSFLPPPPPTQIPRIPIWVVGAWPRPKSMARALRYDGLLPNVMEPGQAARAARSEDVIQMRTYVTQHRRRDQPFDIIVEGETPGLDRKAAGDIVAPFAAAGATWWLEAAWGLANTMYDPAAQLKIRERLRQGPPRGEWD
jgi:alkanesulfonate monooxygenase SsuD/methylene tetrahydromethanopterin reductase-like flavin-dependent oxidoreductase (luciferase family)